MAKISDGYALDRFYEVFLKATGPERRGILRGLQTIADAEDAREVPTDRNAEIRESFRALGLVAPHDEITNGVPILDGDGDLIGVERTVGSDL